MATICMEQTETGSVLGWPISGSGMSASTAQTAGSWSTYSFQQNGNTVGAFGQWETATSTFWGQFRVRFPDTGSASRHIRFISPAGVRQCSIGWTAGGYITIERSEGTPLATGTTVFVQNTWYYVQFYIKVADGTAGECTILVDGVQQFAATNLDTRLDTVDTVDRVNIRNGDGNDFWLDDFIVNDNTDTDNVTYPDNLGIEALMPNAAGDNTGLTRGGSDSGSNYGQVDERGPNDATDYVYDSVVDDYDIYNIPATQWTSVASVALALRCQKSDAGAANIAHMLKIDTDANASADELDTGSDVALSTSWTYHTAYYNRQPDDAGATSWTPAKVNALQAGAKVR